MRVIYVGTRAVYAATDPRRFTRELVRFASVANVSWELARSVAGAHG